MLRTVIPRSVKVSEAPGYSMTIIDYDPGSRGAMSYLDASRELAKRDLPTIREGTTMTQPLRKKGGLGRGLASLIPTGPADGDSGPATLGPRMGDAAADVLIGGPACRTPPRWARCTARSRRPTSSPTRGSRARCSTKRRSPNWCTPSASSACCSRSWCGRCPESQSGARYQIVMGERRWRAAQEAGLATIPAIVRETGDDNLLRDALLENIHRVQLNPLEEAAAYQQLLDEFGVTHDELAARIGRSRPLITNMIRLLKLPIPVQRRVAAGRAVGRPRPGAAVAGSRLRGTGGLAGRIIAEGLSVRATEEAVTLANRGDVTTPSPQRRKPIQMPGLQDVAERPVERPSTPGCTVSLGKRKGRIVVEFGSVEDLQRIVDDDDPVARHDQSYRVITSL